MSWFSTEKVAYINENKKLPVVKNFSWVDTQKQAIKNNKISKERKNLLLNIDLIKHWCDINGY